MAFFTAGPPKRKKKARERNEGLGFVKCAGLQGPLCVGLDRSFVVVTNFLIRAV